MTSNKISAYTIRILNNGREVDDFNDLYETEVEAERAAADGLDNCCSPHSPMRRFYRSEVISHQMTAEQVEEMGGFCGCFSHTTKKCKAHH